MINIRSPPHRAIPNLPFLLGVITWYFFHVSFFHLSVHIAAFLSFFRRMENLALVRRLKCTTFLLLLSILTLVILTNIHPLHRLLTQHRQRGVHIRAAIVYSRQNMTM